MSVWTPIKHLYKRAEISPEFQGKENYLNMLFQFLYSGLVAIIAALFPIRYGFMFVSQIAENEEHSSMTIKEGLLTFEGGFGSFCILIGFLMIAVSVYRVVVKK